VYRCFKRRTQIWSRGIRWLAGAWFIFLWIYYGHYSVIILHQTVFICKNMYNNNHLFKTIHRPLSNLHYSVSQSNCLLWKDDYKYHKTYTFTAMIILCWVLNLHSTIKPINCIKTIIFPRSSIITYIMIFYFRLYTRWSISIFTLIISTSLNFF
jgi:hypothetical protein